MHRCIAAEAMYGPWGSASYPRQQDRPAFGTPAQTKEVRNDEDDPTPVLGLLSAVPVQPHRLCRSCQYVGGGKADRARIRAVAGRARVSVLVFSVGLCA